MASALKLFQSTQVGNLALQHRVVLAPLTRFKSTSLTHIPTAAIMKEYYSQRSRTPGTLLISEATFIAPRAGGYKNAPGIWNEEQIKAWKEVTDAVHANGSFIYLQLWSLGRAADPAVLSAESEVISTPLPYTAPSAVLLPNAKPSANPVIPRELTKQEIQEYIQLYIHAAKNAVEKAGFDGVEIHGANTYLIEQFLREVTNKRTDEYGGSIENRSRFGLEIVEAVVNAVGAKKTGIRLSPWSALYEADGADPVPQYSHFVSQIKDRHPDLAYLHVVEPRINIFSDANAPRDIKQHESNDFLRSIWAPRPFISAGGFTRATALETAEKKGDLVAFGRWYISNPDLPRRLREDIPLTPYNRKTFYTPAEDENVKIGYVDYPFAPASRLVNTVEELPARL